MILKGDDTTGSEIDIKCGGMSWRWTVTDATAIVYIQGRSEARLVDVQRIRDSGVGGTDMVKEFEVDIVIADTSTIQSRFLARLAE